MKNSIKIILLISTSLLLLIGCGAKEEKKTIDNFINKLLSVKTYESFTFWDDLDSELEDTSAIPLGLSTSPALEKYAEDSKAIFEEYFPEDEWLNVLTRNKLPYVYYAVIHYNNVKDITDIKIVKNKETEYLTYTHYEYEVSYKLKLDNKSIDMTDYMEFKIMKDNPSIIKGLSILDETSSIFSEYKNVPQ